MTFGYGLQPRNVTETRPFAKQNKIQMSFKINSSADGSSFVRYFHSENRKAIILIEKCFRLQFHAGRRCHWDISESFIGAFGENSLLSVNRLEMWLSASCAASLWFEYSLYLSQSKCMSFALKDINHKRTLCSACITFRNTHCK